MCPLFTPILVDGLQVCTFINIKKYMYNLESVKDSKSFTWPRINKTEFKFKKVPRGEKNFIVNQNLWVGSLEPQFSVFLSQQINYTTINFKRNMEKTNCTLMADMENPSVISSRCLWDSELSPLICKQGPYSSSGMFAKKLKDRSAGIASL